MTLKSDLSPTKSLYFSAASDSSSVCGDHIMVGRFVGGEDDELYPMSKRPCFCNIIPVALLLCLVIFVGCTYITPDYNERVRSWPVSKSMEWLQSHGCKEQCRPPGSEPLPRGIISTSSNLEMRPLWGFPEKKITRPSKSLLAIAVGIKQKVVVDSIIKKFSSSAFTIMLFHYDGNVGGWKDLSWSGSALHVSAINQTKWWFAKRFLHPDIVAEYSHIFLWDEDIGVEHFNPQRYLSIVEDEGLEISQPALDPTKSRVHHQITARGRRSRVHRRIYKYDGGQKCLENSTAPPCTGWVEMMAPVFSRAAWRCAWYMIQSDLIHAWGLDMKLGYCAQGDRNKNVGVVDSEYITHLGIPTLGVPKNTKMEDISPSRSIQSKPRLKARKDPRIAVRRQSFMELEIFRERWEKAVRQDKCWVDPYSQPSNRTH